MEQIDNLVLTNNPEMIRAVSAFSGFKLEANGGTPGDLVEKCTELVLDGWHFSADPLGGYHARPNPYHTMFFQKKKGSPLHGQQMLRDLQLIDCLGKDYQNQKPFLEKYKGEKYEKDYMAIDSSIAQRSLSRLAEKTF